MLFVVITQNGNIRELERCFHWDLGQDEFKTGQVIGFLLEQQPHTGHLYYYLFLPE